MEEAEETAPPGVDYINTLPNELFVMIIGNLSIRQQIQIREVCTRWNEIHPLVMEKIDPLIILVGEDAQTYIKKYRFKVPYSDRIFDDNGKLAFPPTTFTERNCLEFSTLTQNIVLGLARTFPAVSSLQIAIRGR